MKPYYPGYKRNIFLILVLLGLAFVPVNSLLTYQQRYSELLGYDPETDYLDLGDYNAAHKIQATLNNNQLIWPDTATEWTSAFVKVNLSATIPGRFFHPKVEITIGENTISHSFEIGTEGSRYLNISNLREEITSNTKLLIDTKYVDIESESAEIILFNSIINPDNESILVISPHSDDAEIAVSGLYQKYSENAWIATITSGDATSDNFSKYYPDDRAKAFNLKGYVRVYDSLSVPMIAGIPYTQLFNLGYFEFRTWDMFNDKTTPMQSMNQNENMVTLYERNFPLLHDGYATWNNLLTDLEYVLNGSNPDVIILPHPLLDQFPDHQFSAIALFEALKNVEFDGRLFMYTNHAVTELYPFGSSLDAMTVPLMTNEVALFDSVYSHKLTKDEQIIKILSLESMHDLRQLPNLNTHLSLFDRLINYYRDVRSIRSPDQSYLRRGGRPNELFYVVENENIETFYRNVSSLLDLNN